MLQEDKGSIPVAIWWLLLFLLAMIVAAILWGLPNEQDDLTARAEAALADAGLSNVAVEFQGRDALLTGSASEEEINRAKETLFQVSGVRRVDSEALSMNAAIKSAPLPPPNFTAKVNDNQVTLTGVMPTQQHINAITDAAKARYDTVDNRMTVGKVASADWINRLPGLFADVGDWRSWDFNIGGSGSSFEGLASNAEAVNVLRDGYLKKFSGLKFNARVDSTAVAATLTELLEGTATFKTASAILSTQATSLLDRAIKILKANADTVVTVAGHTDSQGNDKKNETLSRARAQAVVDYLVAGGITAARLTAVGYGEAQPIADNATAAGRAQNRRIEFVVKTEGES